MISSPDTLRSVSFNVAGFHPATFVFLALCLIAGSALGAGKAAMPWPLLSAGLNLLLLLSALLVASVALLRMLRRARWLLLMLFVVPAVSVPGELIGGGLPLVTIEGVRQGALHAFHVAAVLGFVSLLRACLGLEALVMACACLLERLTRNPALAERFAVRLALVMAAVPLQADAKVSNAPQHTLCLPQRTLQYRDHLAMGVASALLALMVFA